MVKKVTEEVLKKINQLHTEGLGYKSISKKLGIGVTTIRYSISPTYLSLCKEKWWNKPKDKIWLHNYYTGAKWKKYRKEYLSRPEIKDRCKKYQHEYSQRPEVKERINKKRRDPEYREKLRASARKSVTRGREKLRREIFEILGSRCTRCGFSDVRAIQVDHINGGGRKEIASFGNQIYRYYKYLLSYLKEDNKNKYQLLCANCNLIKAWEDRKKKCKI